MSVVNSIRDKISSIRRSDEETKRRWHIGLTGFSAFVVIFLWLGYVRIAIPTPDGSPVKREKSDGDSFVTVFSRGVVIISGNIKEKFFVVGSYMSDFTSSFLDKLKNGNEYMFFE